MQNACVVLLASALLAVSGSLSAQSAAISAAPFNPPAESDVPLGPLGDSIRLGEKIVSQTQTYAKAYVGNDLNCTNCHLDGGKTPYASPWVGLWGMFPEYRSRSAKVNALQERINDCFRRSMNGKPLPLESDEMVGVLAYVWWLSKGVPTGIEVDGRGFKHIRLPEGDAPDPDNGKAIYAAKCASCHGANGQGTTSLKGGPLFPPVWGPKSFNIGAGMARLNNAAGFVKVNMPLGQGNTLTDKEAIDVAAYFTRQPRPDFTAKAKDWPKGDRPADAPY